jgi:CheY-like chemotaxis protein
VCATCGADGLALLDEHDVDLILSDVMMPGMDGVQLAGLVAARSNPPPMVLMSGLTSEVMAERARAAGVVQLLAKPVGTAKIGALLLLVDDLDAPSV